jgi:dsRNA-specific ribonuclease
MASVGYKNSIFERAQVMRLPPPVYTHEPYGPAHARVFKCICTFATKKTVGEGATKVSAEEHASKLMFELIIERSRAAEDKTSGGGFYNYILTLIAKEYPEVEDTITEAIAAADPDIDKTYGATFLRYALAQILFNLYPSFGPDQLTAIIIEQIRAETIAALEIALSLSPRMKLSAVSTINTEAKTFLVLIGALARLHEHVAFVFIELCYQESIKKCVTAITSADSFSTKTSVTAKIITTIDNYKNKLQEYAQKRHYPLPKYQVIEIVGLSHIPIYTVTCKCAGVVDEGTCRTKKEAEQAAAKKVLERLEHYESSCRLLTSAHEISFAKMASIDPLSTEILLDLQKNIGYFFHDLDYLKMALTHNSVHPEGHFQRFEFLGDAILRKIILLHLIKSKHFHDYETLSIETDRYIEAPYQAAIAAKLKLNDYLLVNSPISPSILSDALEALIAAIFIDYGKHKHCKEPDRLIIDWFCISVAPIAVGAGAGVMAGAGAGVIRTSLVRPPTSTDFPSLAEACKKAMPPPLGAVGTAEHSKKGAVTFKDVLLKGSLTLTGTRVSSAAYDDKFPTPAEAYGKKTG